MLKKDKKIANKIVIKIVITINRKINFKNPIITTIFKNFLLKKFSIHTTLYLHITPFSYLYHIYYDKDRTMRKNKLRTFWRDSRVWSKSRMGQFDQLESANAFVEQTDFCKTKRTSSKKELIVLRTFFNVMKIKEQISKIILI